MIKVLGSRMEFSFQSRVGVSCPTWYFQYRWYLLPGTRSYLALPVQVVPPSWYWVLLYSYGLAALPKRLGRQEIPQGRELVVVGHSVES